MNLNNENSLFYRIPFIIFSVIVIILVGILISKQYNPKYYEPLIGGVIASSGVNGIFESIIQIKCKNNKISFVIYLLLGVLSIWFGIFLLYK